MLTRAELISRFGRRAVFGMVHLGPLPGSPLFRSLESVIADAVRDAKAIEAGGAAGIVVENFGDRPFTKGRVAAETVAAMTRVIAGIAAVVRIPHGVNVLRNDALSALAIAAATGAAFIRVNVHTGAMVTDQGLIEGAAYETLRLRASLAPDVLIFADHLVKHAVPLAAVDALQSAKDLRLRGLADAIVVTGAETGAPADPARLQALREVTDAPLIIGSGLSAGNAATFTDADAAIAGTQIKRRGDLAQPVERRRVERVVRAFASR